ncbi:MAG: hypothetical protein PHW54_05685 [Candidatus Omnitrophica bacterium]|nr:hypothetical protein [Candidatus Omnitrophota bacterium]
MNKKKIVIVIGKNRSGKSTIISNLTGCGGKTTGNFSIDLGIYVMENLQVNPLRRLYVIPSSLQENRRATINR